MKHFKFFYKTISLLLIITFLSTNNVYALRVPMKEWGMDAQIPIRRVVSKSLFTTATEKLGEIRSFIDNTQLNSINISTATNFKEILRGKLEELGVILTQLNLGADEEIKGLLGEVNNFIDNARLYSIDNWTASLFKEDFRKKLNRLALKVSKIFSSSYKKRQPGLFSGGIGERREMVKRSLVTSTTNDFGEFVRGEQGGYSGIEEIITVLAKSIERAWGGVKVSLRLVPHPTGKGMRLEGRSAFGSLEPVNLKSKSAIQLRSMIEQKKGKDWKKIELGEGKWENIPVIKEQLLEVISAVLSEKEIIAELGSSTAKTPDEPIIWSSGDDERGVPWHMRPELNLLIDESNRRLIVEHIENIADRLAKSDTDVAEVINRYLIDITIEPYPTSQQFISSANIVCNSYLFIIDALKKKEFSDEDIKRFNKAFALGLWLHRGEVLSERDTLPYFIHPVSTARILIETYDLLNLQNKEEAIDILSAALLHRAVNNKNNTIPLITEVTSKKVVEIRKGLKILAGQEDIKIIQHAELIEMAEKHDPNLFTPEQMMQAEIESMAEEIAITYSLMFMNRGRLLLRCYNNGYIQGGADKNLWPLPYYLYPYFTRHIVSTVLKGEGQLDITIFDSTPEEKISLKTEIEKKLLEAVGLAPETIDTKVLARPLQPQTDI